MNIRQALSVLKGDNINKNNLLTGLGIEQVGKLIYLIFKSPTDSQNNIRLARSHNGFDFTFIKILKDNYIREKISPKIIKLIQPRIEYFDNGPLEIEGIIKISQGKLIIYHHYEWQVGYQVGTAIIKNNKIIFRGETPIWESSSTWANEKIKFIGLAFIDGQIIGYWEVNNQIQAVIYPSFKLRNPQTARNIKIGLKRSMYNPIILPNPENNWESEQTFNPGVILLDNKFHFLYRAIGKDGVSRLGYAVSENGFSIKSRLPYPVYTHDSNEKNKRTFGVFPSGGSWSGAEDPRLVRVANENIIYATYTACDQGLRIGLTSITVDDFMNGRWNWNPPIIISPPGQIHKNWVIFPEKIRGHYAILHAVTPNVMVEYFDDLGFKGEKNITQSTNPQLIPPQNSSWDRRIRGAGAPPLKTDYGWLLFYHAMDYKVGVMLLDLDDPTKIIYRSKAPVLESSEPYENSGFKPGIIYVSGAVIQDGRLYVYYGSSDSYVCVASANLDEFLRQLRYGEKPIFEPAKIIKIK
ncbi:MAG: hypothetical protein WC069_04065 [Candidatus Shapirobacteria bacterium]